MKRGRNQALIILGCLAFLAAVWGSVDCGVRLSQPGLDAAEETHLRHLIYFHFAVAQLLLVVAGVLFWRRHRKWKRYYLVVSYNEKGVALDPPGIRIPASRLFRCHLHEPLETAALPPPDAPILVYPMFMLSGTSSGARLQQWLREAYARRFKGAQPQLFFQPVLGASPWLAEAAARRLRERNRLQPDTGILVVAHGSRLPEPPPEPALFCRRLRELLPGTEVALGYFHQTPDAAAVMAGMQSRRILLLPFLLTEGIHTRRDLPTAEQAAACGKELTRLQVAASMLDYSSPSRP